MMLQTVKITMIICFVISLLLSLVEVDSVVWCYNFENYSVLNVNQGGAYQREYPFYPPRHFPDYLRNIARVKTHILLTNSSRFEFFHPPAKLFYEFPILMWSRSEDFVGGETPENVTIVAPYGIAAMVDWMIINFSYKKPMIFGTTLTPQMVYVQVHALEHFANVILPHIRSKFVLVTVSNDHTIPMNLDRRFGLTRNNLPTWNKIMANPNVLHWYVENLSGLYPKASPLPIGTWSNIAYASSDQKPFMNRVMKMLVTDRVHDMHEQFADRVFVATQCRQMHDVCVHAHSGIKKLANLDIMQWSRLVSEHMFHICVHGGGIDPSPKAWETIILGSIPIIEHSSLDEAYSQLPVAFVKNMTEFITWTNHTAVLQQWKEELGAYYIERSEKRNQTLYRLTNLYWHAQITKHIPNYRHIEE